MTDHPRLTRYIPSCIGTAYAGMSKERAPGLYGPEWDLTHGPYVLAVEADAEIERLRAEIERLREERTAYRALAGIGFSGTDEADELAALPPLARDQEAFRRKQERQSGLIARAPHCPTCGCGASEPNTPAPRS